MGNLPITLLPPQNWQDFEKMIRGVVEVIWPQHGWHNYGRAGQTQSGIDIYGYDDRSRVTGIQCKKKTLTNPQGELLIHSLLTENLIREEILEAEKIERPPLERMILATTSSTDKNIQDTVRAINHERIKNGKFTVELWFWDDFQVHIEKHTELMYWYYSELLEKIHRYSKDVHILTMLRQAFTRPAFSREIRGEESGGDFIDAIKGSQEAITTGKLYNRRNDLIATSFDFRHLTDKRWRDAFQTINRKLNDLRKLYSAGLAKDQIREHETCLEVRDDKIAEELNIIRGDCLDILNKVLTENNLDIVENELLRYRI